MLRLQRAAGNQAVARLVGERQDAAAAAGGGGGGGAPPPPAPAPPPVAPAAPAAPAVDAVSGAGGSPAPPAPAPAAAGPAPAAGAAATPAAAALPAPLAALATVRVADAPGLLQVASIGVSTLGNQASVRAHEKNQLKGPAPTGLPTGAEPPELREPTIPEPGTIAPAGDADSPADIAAATQGGKAQIEAGRAAAERAAGADTGVGALAPTEPREEIPSLGLAFVFPGGGPPPIATIPDPEVAAALEGGFGNEGRETASRELAGGAELLQQHDEAVDKQQGDAAQQLAAENERAKLEQVAAREEARMGVETDKAQLRRENAEAIAEYQREAAAEQAAAQAEVVRAKEEARRAEDAARNQPEEDDDEAWYERAWGAVKSGAKAVGGAIKGAVVKAYKFVKDRVTRFFSKVAELVSDGIAKIREIGGRIYRGIRDKIKAGLRRINEIARRIGRWVADLVERVGTFISGLVKDLVNGFMDLLGRIADFFRHAWEIAVQIKDFIVALAKGAVQLFIELVRDPGAVIERAKNAIGELIANTPAKIQEVYDQYLGPVIDGPVAAKGPAAEAEGGEPEAGAVIARQPAQEEEVGEEETHSEGVWRHLTVRGNYFVDHWWEVVKDALFEILVPGVAIYRHLPKAWDDLMLAWDEWKAGRRSRAIDSILDAAREIMAVFAAFIAQVSIAAFIIGSILGTPIVGVAALAAIGLTVIAIDVSLQAATIAKAIYNLQGGEDDDDDNRLEKDYGRIADSSIAIVIMLVLVLLGAVASKAASSMIRRFPALGRAAESLKVKVRKKLGIKPKVPTKITSKMKPIEPMPPDAVGYDAVRSKLSPEYQRALDKFVAERPPDQVKAALDSKKDASGNPDIAKVEAMLKNQVKWVREQEALRADNARWEGEMLDPKMKNGPVQQGGKDVWARWNDKPPTPEISQAERLNAKTGERVELFGDDYPGIDGTIGHPPRPLQLKSVPASEPIPELPRVAADALDKAHANGFSRIEVSIEAPGRTVKQVREAFEASKRPFTDSKGVSRVRVWCDDGVFEPTSFTPRIAPHPGPDVKDPDKQTVPAGVGG